MIRNAIESDYKGIRGMLAQGVEEGTLQPRSKKDIKKSIRKNRVVVSDEEGKLTGMASVVVYNRRLGEVRSLFVSPSHRGNGLATDLVNSLLEKPLTEVPCGTLIAITGTPRVFEKAGFDIAQGKSQVLFKRI